MSALAVDKRGKQGQNSL